MYSLPKGDALSLPKGWELKKLEELGKVLMCKRILKKQTTSIGDIPFYKIGTFGKTANAFISKEIYEEFRSKYSFPKKGDVLLSASGTIGRRVVYDGNPAYFQDSNIVWIQNNGKKVLNEYLYEFYGFCDWNPSTGATISRLYNDDLRRIRISFPKSKEEQKRIVAILEKAFTAIDQAKANTEKNLKNARELFQSKLQETFANGKLKIDTGEWEEKKLGEVCDVRDGTHDSPKYINKGFALITSKNLKNDTLNYDKVKYISEEDYTNINKRSKVDVGDILFAMIGTIGNPVVIKNKPCFAIKNVALFKVPKDQDSYFFKYYLDSQYVIQKMQKDAKGATQRFVGLGYLRNFRIPLPPLPEQKQIVKKLDVVSTETKKLETIYQQKITCLDELKKSILQKAFNGEL